MPWLAPVIGGVASIAGGAIGAGQASGDRQAAREAYQASVDDLTAIGIPAIEAQQIVLEQYKQEGKLTPELEEDIKSGPSAYEGISTNPQFKDAELEALDQLREIGSSGGMTLRDQANLERTMGRVDSAEKGRRDASLSGMAARGQLGSGLELAARTGFGQEDASARHLAGVEAAADASDRALEAIKAAGGLGSNLRGEEFGEQERIASAKDKISQFNTENSRAVQARNVGARNDANKYNVVTGQDIADRNVDQRNKQETFNKELQQTQFDNQMQVAQAKANARAGQASNFQKSADATANTWANIGSGVNKAALAAGDYLSRKKDEEK